MYIPVQPNAIRRRCGGFALIIVLWTLVLLAFIAAHLMRNGRTEVHIAGNLVANAVTGAAADGGVSQAIFRLLATGSTAHWSLGGAAQEFSIGHCRLTVQVRDEGARINPNLASTAMLETLLRVTGSDRESARRLATAIGEWTGAATVRPSNAILADYRKAGLNYGPPGEPLETLDELGRVLGMTPPVLAAIRPHLSLFAPAEPDVTDADPVVRSVIAALGQPVNSNPAKEGPSIRTVRITVTAKGPNNARVRRTAVVRISRTSGSYTVLAWSKDAE